jgi:hypothetical protein
MAANAYRSEVKPVSIPSAQHSRHALARPHVVAIVPRGEVIRNFVYSGAFDEVAKHGKLSLLSILPGGDVEADLRRRFDALIPLEEKQDPWPIRIQREILEMAHGRWLWSEAAQERLRLRDLEARSALDRIKRIGKKAACFPLSNRRGLGLLSKFERLSSRALSTYQHYFRLYNELQPDLVFNGSHVHSRIAMQAIQTAEWMGIKTATFLFSWDNLTSQGRIMLPYDYYFAWNNAIRDQLLDIYHDIRPEQVIVTGTPQFDLHFRKEFAWSRERFCAEVGADPSRQLVLYSTGMANHMPGEPEIVEGIADALASMPDLNSPQLLVRVYPKDLTGRFEELRGRRPEILFQKVPWEPAWLTPKLEDSYLLANTLRHVDVGINVASTVSLELCMFDKPVINIGYNPPGVAESELSYARYYEFDHYKPIVASGAVPVARNLQELNALLREGLEDPAQRSPERNALIHKMFGDSLDGHAGRRIGNCLVDLAIRQCESSSAKRSD